MVICVAWMNVMLEGRVATSVHRRPEVHGAGRVRGDAVRIGVVDGQDRRTGVEAEQLEGSDAQRRVVGGVLLAGVVLQLSGLVGTELALVHGELDASPIHIGDGLAALSHLDRDVGGRLTVRGGRLRRDGGGDDQRSTSAGQ